MRARPAVYTHPAVDIVVSPHARAVALIGRFGNHGPAVGGTVLARVGPRTTRVAEGAAIVARRAPHPGLVCACRTLPALTRPGRGVQGAWGAQAAPATPWAVGERAGGAVDATCLASLVLILPCWAQLAEVEHTRSPAKLPRRAGNAHPRVAIALVPRPTSHVNGARVSDGECASDRVPQSVREPCIPRPASVCRRAIPHVASRLAGDHRPRGRPAEGQKVPGGGEGVDVKVKDCADLARPVAAEGQDDAADAVGWGGGRDRVCAQGGVDCGGDSDENVGWG
mmetsp:Transcript_56860/g.137470  ORF Transcript_56860/g.137470 Transcript_56860/m.137470 type:complete len:282 (+) Transcript_56860:2802-3647(+)